MNILAKAIDDAKAQVERGRQGTIPIDDVVVLLLALEDYRKAAVLAEAMYACWWNNTPEKLQDAAATYKAFMLNTRVKYGAFSS